ncbi:MAG: lipocalin-like protein [Verrucomicrobia bacterium]|nr:lipocalin-like protein [Verrucomicrobiota bacterium]
MKTSDTPSQPPLSAELIGTWELLSREDNNHAGERRIEPSLGSDPIALLYFDAKGHFAAQFMKRQRVADSEPAPLTKVPNNSRARGGYDAYFGNYQVDDGLGTVSTTLVGALSPENVGQVYVRHIAVVGDELTLRLDTAASNGEPIKRTLRWKRVG